jgi:hypothetical protein
MPDAFVAESCYHSSESMSLSASVSSVEIPTNHSIHRDPVMQSRRPTAGVSVSRMRRTYEGLDRAVIGGKDFPGGVVYHRKPVLQGEIDKPDCNPKKLFLQTLVRVEEIDMLE